MNSTKKIDCKRCERECEVEVHVKTTRQKESRKKKGTRREDGVRKEGRHDDSMKMTYMRKGTNSTAVGHRTRSGIPAAKPKASSNARVDDEVRFRSEHITDRGTANLLVVNRKELRAKPTDSETSRWQ